MEPNENIPNIQYMEDERPVVDINYQYNDSTENDFNNQNNFEQEQPSFENNFKAEEPEFELPSFENFNPNLNQSDLKAEDNNQFDFNDSQKKNNNEVKETNFDKLLDAVHYLNYVSKNMNTSIDNLCKTISLVDEQANSLGTTAEKLFTTITKLGSEETLRKLVDEMK